jgi:hypothetical protein
LTISWRPLYDVVLAELFENPQKDKGVSYEGAVTFGSLSKALVSLVAAARRFFNFPSQFTIYIIV